MNRFCVPTIPEQTTIAAYGYIEAAFVLVSFANRVLEDRDLNFGISLKTFSVI